MGIDRALIVMLGLAIAGCGSVVDGTPETTQQAGGAGRPEILPSQLDQLLTPPLELSVVPGHPLIEQDMQASLFVAADPPECHGVVGFGHFPLFPSNYTGREFRTQMDTISTQHQLLEVASSYPSSFDAVGFLDSVRQHVNTCQHPVSAWGDDGKKLQVLPAPLISSPPEIVHWYTNLAGDQWTCEFSVIAKANVGTEIVTCSPDRSLDNPALATKRLAKINELLNSKV